MNSSLINDNTKDSSWDESDSTPTAPINAEAPTATPEEQKPKLHDPHGLNLPDPTPSRGGLAKRNGRVLPPIPGPEEVLPAGVVESLQLLQEARQALAAVKSTIVDVDGQREKIAPYEARVDRIGRHYSKLQQGLPVHEFNAQHMADAAAYRRGIFDRNEQRQSVLEKRVQLPVDSIPITTLAPGGIASIADFARHRFLVGGDVRKIQQFIRACDIYELSYLRNYSEAFPEERIEHLQHVLAATSNPDERRKIADEIDRLKGPTSKDLATAVHTELRRQFGDVQRAQRELIEAVYVKVSSLQAEMFVEMTALFKRWSQPVQEDLAMHRAMLALLAELETMRTPAAEATVSTVPIPSLGWIGRFLGLAAG